MEFSNLYIDENGFLMCGVEKMSTSIVDGLRFNHNNETGSYWDYEINLINDLGQTLNTII